MSNPAALLELNGTSVLVTSARDQSRPPAGVRGTLEITPDNSRSGGIAAAVAIEMPAMFSAAPSTRRVVLDDKAIAQLEHLAPTGGREIVLDVDL